MKQKQNALFAAQNQCKLTVSKGRGLGTQGRGEGLPGNSPHVSLAVAQLAVH